MGFVDLVGVSNIFIKNDFRLTDTTANLLATMVFFWFLIFSVPTGMLMNRIGRKKTVLISLIVTFIALLIPSLHYSFGGMLVAFSFLGIGNTLMQVSLNPLLSNIISGEKLASSLTFGQFIKAIASFAAPVIVTRASLQFDNWRVIFPVFMVICILAVVALGITQIREDDEKGPSSSIRQCFALLGDKLILLSFLGIMCHVGIDVGINMTAPKILIERLGVTPATAGLATMVYFLFRTIGCLAGAILLIRFPQKLFFIISCGEMVLSMTGLFIFSSLIPLYICVALVGLGNSNIFPIILSQALLYMPQKKNEVSGLMMMGISGGAVFPPIMGIASDSIASQTGAVLVLSVGVIYLLLLARKIKNQIS